MKPITPFVLLLTCLPIIGFAQSYDVAGGLRVGTDWGLTAKVRVANKTAIEAILQSSIKRDETMISLLAEQHFPIITRRISLYGGAGLHKGWLADGDETDPAKDPFGLSLIGGVELTLGRLNLSYDFKPAINLVGGERTFYTQTGISARYVLFKRYDLFAKPKRQKSGFGKLWDKVRGKN